MCAVYDLNTYMYIHISCLTCDIVLGYLGWSRHDLLLGPYDVD